MLTVHGGWSLGTRVPCDLLVNQLTHGDRTLQSSYRSPSPFPKRCYSLIVFLHPVPAFLSFLRRWLDLRHSLSSRLRLRYAPAIRRLQCSLLRLFCPCPKH